MQVLYHSFGMNLAICKDRAIEGEDYMGSRNPSCVTYTHYIYFHKACLCYIYTLDVDLLLM